MNTKKLTPTRRRNLTINSKEKEQRISGNTNYLPVVMAFVIFFIYGFLLLMVSYTGGPILKETNFASYPMLSPIPQTVGLVVVVLGLKLLVKKLNMRWIMSVGFFIALCSICLTFLIPHLSNQNKNTGTVLYIISNFALGIGVGAVSPGVIVFFAQRFQGNTRNVMLSAVNGVYGIGAGIIPLALSTILYKNTDKGFDSVKNFLYIAMTLAAVGLFLSLLLNVPPTKSDALSTTESKNKKKRIPFSNKYMTSQKMMICVILVIALFTMYMFVETTANYNLNNIIKGQHFSTSTKQVKTDRFITAIRCIGLMFIVQGVWRALSGLTICKVVKYRYFIAVSVILIISAYIILLTKKASPDSNVSQYRVFAYLTAILLGLGLGNIWPVLTSYVTSIDNSRAALVSVWLNRTAQIAMLGTQFIVGFSVATQANSTMLKHKDAYMYVFIAAIIIAGMFFLLICCFPLILRTMQIPHENDISKKKYAKLNK